MYSGTATHQSLVKQRYKDQNPVHTLNTKHKIHALSKVKMLTLFPTYLLPPTHILACIPNLQSFNHINRYTPMHVPILNQLVQAALHLVLDCLLSVGAQARHAQCHVVVKKAG